MIENIALDWGMEFSAALGAFERLAGRWLTVHDQRGIMMNESGEPLFPDRLYHNNPFCCAGRWQKENGDRWNGRCLRDCARTVEAQSLRSDEPFLHRCWKGAAQLVVPVYQGGELALIFYVGPFRGAKSLRGNGMEELYAELPDLPKPEVLRDWSMLLRSIGSDLMEKILHRGAAEIKDSSRKAHMIRYIESNAHREASLRKLAAELNLSPSRTRHLVTVYFGISFQELLLRERMKRARKLLLAGDRSQKEIAAAVGIPNVYYFNRCFKLFFGVPPGRMVADAGTLPPWES